MKEQTLLKTLNWLLSLNLITTDEYNTLLQKSLPFL